MIVIFTFWSLGRNKRRSIVRRFVTRLTKQTVQTVQTVGRSTSNSFAWCGELTDGAVGARPVGLADAGPRVGVEGAVAGALLRTSALQDLAAGAPPARVAVALAVVTGPVGGARRVGAVH